MNHGQSKGLIDKSKVLSESNKQVKLQDKFNNLSKTDQEYAINFFNLHNSAIFLYTQCSDDAKAYIDYSIQLSQGLNDIDLDKQMEDQKNEISEIASRAAMSDSLVEA